MKKISVIIAIYNVAEYLSQCLESVINQTYSNLEIICINDGSTDGSAEICDNYAKQDKRIVVVHKENGGECSARNKGLEIFTGDYVSMIDGDDYLEKDMYRKLVEMIEMQDNIGISVCGYFMDYPNEIKWIQNEKVVPETATKMEEFLYYIYIRDEYRGVASYLWNKLFRAYYFKDEEIRFPNDLNIGHDVLISARCYIKTDKIIYTKKPYYHYRQRESSVMHLSDERLEKLSSCLAYERVIKLYEQNGVSKRLINYVKRFYVYHASLLLQMAYKKNDKGKALILKKYIKKYLWTYIRTNFKKPSRIIYILLLLRENRIQGMAFNEKNKDIA